MTSKLTAADNAASETEQTVTTATKETKATTVTTRRMSAIRSTQLNQADLEKFAADDRAGAVVTFTGVVRNHDNGDEVSSLDYSAHPDAEKILEDLTAEIAAQFPLYALAVEHRVGHVEVGELAMVAVVSAGHRKESFAAIEALVNLVKAKLPIWKEQFYPGQTSDWVGLPN